MSFKCSMIKGVLVIPKRSIVLASGQVPLQRAFNKSHFLLEKRGKSCNPLHPFDYTGTLQTTLQFNTCMVLSMQNLLLPTSYLFLPSTLNHTLQNGTWPIFIFTFVKRENSYRTIPFEFQNPIEEILN